MNLMRNVVRMFCAVLLLLWLGVSYGTDFTFTVPVNVSNLPPEIDQVTVCCQVSDAAAGGRLIGSGGVCSTQSVSGHAFSGEFTIPYNADPGVNPATARAYNCYAGFYGMVSGTRTGFSLGTLGSRNIPLSSGSLSVRGAITP